MSVYPRKSRNNGYAKFWRLPPNILHKKGELWAILKWYGEKYLKPFYYDINMY